MRPAVRWLPRVCAALAFSSTCLANEVAKAQSAPSEADVCDRWVADRADLSEGVSTADVPSCTVGAWGAPGPANSLKLVNLYRFIAAMPAVTEDPSYDLFAQSCAVLQAANSAAGLSHTPDAAAACYSTMGATGSEHSSICGGEGVACIDLYMSDKGSAELGHRRWVFANDLGPVGFGSVGTGGRTATGSCFYQPAGSTNPHFPYVAWPPGGNVPLQAITTTQTDAAGWSVQSDTINLGSATATVTDGTTNLPVTVAVLPANFGSTYAIRILPTGWTSQPGHSYAVAIAGTATPIDYTVNVVDCSAFDGGAEGSPGDAASSSSSSDAGSAGGAPSSGSTDSSVSGGSSGDPADATTDMDATRNATSAKSGSGSGGCSCETAGLRAEPGLAFGVALGALGLCSVRRRSSKRRAP